MTGKKDLIPESNHDLARANASILQGLVRVTEKIFPEMVREDLPMDGPFPV